MGDKNVYIHHKPSQNKIKQNCANILWDKLNKAKQKIVSTNEAAIKCVK